MELSPFSLQHDWSINWEVVPSGINIDPRVAINSTNERRALEAIASVGVISKHQLIQLFSLREKQLKSMEKSFKILKHELIKNKEEKTIIYTLNTKGALALGLDNYKVNYWLEYYTNDVLKSLLYFQVYYFFPKLNIKPTPKPFTGGVETKSNMIYVYVVKGNNDDLSRFLKWEKKQVQRLVIVVENPQQLKHLELYLKDLKIRVALEKDLVSGDNTEQNIFYTYKDGRFVR